MTFQKAHGAPWLYDNETGDLVGVKDPDRSEFYWMRIPHIGSFYDVLDQSASVNTATAMLLRGVAISRGVTIVDNSKITISRSGTYNIQFSAMFSNPESTAYAISFWLRKNNNNVPDSNTDLTVPTKHGQVNGKAVAAINFFVDAEPGDYFELMWSTPMATIIIEHQDAQTDPVRPVTPSVILTINEVDGNEPQ